MSSSSPSPPPQENVSCLNTSLVILMLARRRGKLPFYLGAFREKEYTDKYPGFLLNNFHHLLRFWQHHYLNKDKDSTCLENVSAEGTHWSRVGLGLWGQTYITVLQSMSQCSSPNRRERQCQGLGLQTSSKRR